MGIATSFAQNFFQNIFTHTTNGSGYGTLATPPLFSLGLSSTYPAPDGSNVTEPVGNGYARIPMTTADWEVYLSNTAWAANYSLPYSGYEIVDNNGMAWITFSNAGSLTGATEPPFESSESYGLTLNDNQVTWQSTGPLMPYVYSLNAIRFAATGPWCAGSPITNLCMFDTADSTLYFSTPITPAIMVNGATLSFAAYGIFLQPYQVISV